MTQHLFLPNRSTVCIELTTTWRWLCTIYWIYRRCIYLWRLCGACWNFSRLGRTCWTESIEFGIETAIHCILCPNCRTITDSCRWFWRRGTHSTVISFALLFTPFDCHIICITIHSESITTVSWKRQRKKKMTRMAKSRNVIKCTVAIGDVVA